MDAQVRRQRKAIEERLRAMGVETQGLPGGGPVVATLPLSSVPFETLEGPREVPSVLFTAVGTERIKCLRPRLLFQLPMISIDGCSDAASLEARIRLTWQSHLETLRKAEGWLRQTGVAAEPAEEGSILTLSIGADDPDARAAMVQPGTLVLPGRGPLAGIALERAEDRILRVEARCASAVDLEIAATSRLQELAKLHARLQAERRRLSADPRPPRVKQAHKQSHRVLLVGPRLTQDQACRDALRVRGYRVDLATSAVDALRAFDAASPELVLAEMNLGRSEGIELIPALRQVPGIEEVPVLLVDDRVREERREVARRVGATGYLVHPVDVRKIADRIASIVKKPKRRRFTRYERRLSVAYEQADRGGTTRSLSRGGMLLWADRDVPIDSFDRYWISLPELDETLRVDAQLIYKLQVPGMSGEAVGLCFQAFPDDDESLLISYVSALEEAQVAK